MNNSTALPISIRGLTKKYGDLNALNSVDLEIKSSELLTLLGPSGSGKTTLLMAIAGFNLPDAGSIKFGGAEMVLTPPHKRDVGMVFQSYALFPHMTVSENIGFPLKLRGLAAKEVMGRVDEALATVQLSGLGDRAIDQLSGGQRQRVARGIDKRSAQPPLFVYFPVSHHTQIVPSIVFRRKNEAIVEAIKFPFGFAPRVTDPPRKIPPPFLQEKFQAVRPARSKNQVVVDVVVDVVLRA